MAADAAPRPPMDDAMAALPPGETIRLRHGALEVELAPAAGGRIAQIRVDGQPWLIGPDDGWPAAIAWGCYPMVPWAGRIRGGAFAFDGERRRLPANLPPHAIHGVGFTRPWRVESHSASEAELSLALPQDAHWPFGGHARQSIRIVDDRTLRLALSVQAGAKSMPVALGWHPWFRKPRRLDFAPTHVYPRDAEGIATLPLAPPPPGPWDDCFLHRGAITLHGEGQRLHLASDCTHWVVYDGTDHATCVEPQTGPPDAFNLAPAVLAPGQALSAWFTLAWDVGDER